MDPEGDPISFTARSIPIRWWSPAGEIGGWFTVGSDGSYSFNTPSCSGMDALGVGGMGAIGMNFQVTDGYSTRWYDINFGVYR